MAHFASLARRWAGKRRFRRVVSAPSYRVLGGAIRTATAKRLPDIVFFAICTFDGFPDFLVWLGLPWLVVLSGWAGLPFVSPATRAWLTALWLIDPLPPFIRRARIFADVAILRLIANPAIRHETVLIGIFSAPSP